MDSLPNLSILEGLPRQKGENDSAYFIGLFVLELNDTREMLGTMSETQ